MSNFLNEYDAAVIARDVDPHTRPNLAHAAVTLARLVDWTNRNSDGWPYWSKPRNASQKLADHLHREYLGRYDGRTGDDITDAELAAGNRTVKAFLTRQGVTQVWSDGALRSVSDRA
jgi:hypothetical protein